MKQLLYSMIALMCGTHSILAQPADLSHDDANNIIRSMDGEWAGVLEYVNYSDGRRVEIPMALEQEASAIAPIAVRRVLFTDPGKTIESGEIVVIDAENLVLSIRPLFVSADAGGGELWTITAAEIATPDDWTLVLVRSGRDDNRPASIRLTKRMVAGTLSSRKDVKYTDGDTTHERNKDFVFRNEFRVKRKPIDP